MAISLGSPPLIPLIVIETGFAVDPHKRALVAKSAPPPPPMVVGARVPATVKTYPVPTWIAQDFPALRTYSCVIAEGRMGFVDPNTNEIKFIVDVYPSQRP